MILGIVFIPLMIIACSDEFAGDNDSPGQERPIKQKLGGVSNPQNLFDGSGVLYEEIADLYDASHFNHTTVDQVIEAVDSLYTSHTLAVFGSPSPTLDPYRSAINTLVNDPSESLTLIGSSPNLGVTARLSLVSFTNYLLLHKSDDYEDIYDGIIGYEQSVLSSDMYSPFEKQSMLTATSILRYSLFRKRRKDKDWETSVGNIVASIYGSSEGMATGIKISLVVEICRDHDIYQQD